jgi:hypothetical protein
MSTALSLALLFSATSADVQFWDWFVKAEVHLPDACAKPKQIPDAEKEIRERLKVARPALLAEVSCDPRTKRPTLTISADGAQDQFTAVKDVTSAIPRLKRWAIVSFRQRRPPQPVTGPQGRRITALDFAFHETGKTNGKLDVEIFIKGLTPETKEALLVAMYSQLDCLLGELDTEAKLGSIELLAMPDKKPNDLKVLTDLPKVVDKQ